jgi:HlyD family secretion protein
MKRIVAVIVVVVIVAVVAIGVGYWWGKGRKPKDALVLYGNVDVRQVDIGFRVSGQVGQLFFEEGDWVSKGALMAYLDKTPYDNVVMESIANVESIKASYDNAEKLLQRRKELIDAGGISQEDLDNAQATRNELFANLKQAEASLAVSLDNLAFTEAFAPADGVVLTRIREPGTVVKESDPVYTLSIASPVWIRAFVDETHLGDVFYGMEAEVRTDTPDAPVYHGKVGFISPVAEFTPKTVETTQLRTDLVYRLRIYVDNPDKYLKQGMPVTVKLKLGKPSEGTSRHH